jgi:hypothetical protein
MFYQSAEYIRCGCLVHLDLSPSLRHPPAVYEQIDVEVAILAMIFRLVMRIWTSAYSPRRLVASRQFDKTTLMQVRIITVPRFDGETG